MENGGTKKRKIIRKFIEDGEARLCKVVFLVSSVVRANRRSPDGCGSAHLGWHHKQERASIILLSIQTGVVPEVRNSTAMGMMRVTTMDKADVDDDDVGGDLDDSQALSMLSLKSPSSVSPLLILEVVACIHGLRAIFFISGPESSSLLFVIFTCSTAWRGHLFLLLLLLSSASGFFLFFFCPHVS